MEPRSLTYVAASMLGELRAGSPETRVARVCSDSRQVQPGDLFFALAGERFDGHEFITEVASKGVAAVVAERTRMTGKMPECGVIVVDNTRQALGRLAARYRQDFQLPIIAVGGSNGKTSTKELLAGVLKKRLNTLWSEASFNNDIGVPATLLRLEKANQAAVLEIGTNHPGELAPLVSMIQPKFGIITSIGREHLEFFGDVAGVADEEGWLAELLPADGKLFLNGDSDWTKQIARRTRATVVRVGFGAGNDWRVTDAKMDLQGVVFQVDAPDKSLSGQYRTALLGRHQALNATFALAVGAELGLTRDHLEQGLSDCKSAKMRLQLSNWNGICVIDDAYNANADSMLAALNTLQEMPCVGRRVAVLGDMAELGAHSEAAHEEVGRRVAELGLNRLFAVGKMAGAMAKSARDAGLAEASEFDDVPAAAAAVKNFLKAGDVVLLKASRSTRLERLFEMLKS
ncbi:UDP-N-acetylmuramoyl-tripeptide--D-alanyl-D-alanine ligase [Pedosphaera parvula]|uniref:UDP-N-acetylmuramoyl-tripeptide--D-alanyl-D-alanine ligase n=1 Tax=Pedosphaera parvula (strain Ellin514) TaxID=320771 RepID=B9XIH1_PEDPL|nr:UDP-N-acetylmuramoyl-tripeptide--D-alanyl-D-alanine ligase [Pedosphaera parvula]EEF60432.1 UDP-N-acetylmuramoylalanyl-D-glutamyl-2,6-diaminopimelate/D-alanyl-D-alanyl ligase [Pedosphaera parvula Ellin514]